jgi:hypothetical protein
MCTNRCANARSYSACPSSALKAFDYGFAENGLTAYKNGEPLPSASFIKEVGEERYKPLVNFVLHYIADLDIPIKRYALRLPQIPALFLTSSSGVSLSTSEEPSLSSETA